MVVLCACTIVWCLSDVRVRCHYAPVCVYVVTMCLQGFLMCVYDASTVVVGLSNFGI